MCEKVDIAEEEVKKDLLLQDITRSISSIKSEKANIYDIIYEIENDLTPSVIVNTDNQIHKKENNNKPLLSLNSG